MQVVSREMIVDAIDRSEADGELELRVSYSGRGMYGESCFGFVGRESALTVLFIELGALDRDLARRLASHMRSDSMGRDTIFYFPGFQLDDQAEPAGELYGLDRDSEKWRSSFDHA